MFLLAAVQIKKHVHVPVKACEKLTHWWKIHSKFAILALPTSVYTASWKKEGGRIKMRLNQSLTVNKIKCVSESAKLFSDGRNIGIASARNWISSELFWPIKYECMFGASFCGRALAK